MTVMTLKDVTDFFKELNTSENWGIQNFYRGKLDNKKEKSVGFYNLKDKVYTPYVGGPTTGKDRDFYCSILIHWTKEYSPCEEVSSKIYNKIIELYDDLDLEIGGFQVNYLELLSGNEDVGTDDNNVYERVIQLKICYNVKD